VTVLVVMDPLRCDCCCWTKEWNISNGLLFDDILFIGGDEAAAAGVAVVADVGPNGSKGCMGCWTWMVQEADKGCCRYYRRCVGTSSPPRRSTTTLTPTRKMREAIGAPPLSTTIFPPRGIVGGIV
jgi:hypothetical protein